MPVLNAAAAVNVAVLNAAAAVSAAGLALDIAAARGRVQQLREAAETSGAGDAGLLAANRQAVETHRKAVESWATKQAEEVLRGTRTYANWQGMGVQLKKDAEYLLKNFAETTGLFAKVASWAGGLFSRGQAEISAKVAAIREDVRQVGELRRIVKERSALLKSRGVKLSPEASETLYGPPAVLAEETWTRVSSLLDGLLKGVQAVAGGKAELRDNGQGDLEVVALSGPVAQQLGAVQFAVGGVLAVIAALVALVVALRSYYNHADQVTRAELESQENRLVATGQLTAKDVTKLRELRNEADRNREGDSLGATIAKAVAGAAALGGGIWLGWKVLDRFVFSGGRR